jgi:acetyl-CoA synthetase
MSVSSYEEACSAHRWAVPGQYNLAADVCDKHPRDKPAMVWESFDGSYREVVWGELQDLANQAAHTLAAHGVERGDRVAIVLPPTPDRRDLLRCLEIGRDPAFDVSAVWR